MNRLVLPLTAVALALFVAAAGACGGGGQDPTPTPPPRTDAQEPTPTPEPILDAASVDITADRLADFRSALGDVARDTALNFTLDAGVEAAVAGIVLDISVLAEGYFDPPDQSMASLSVDLGFVSSDFEVVSAAGQSYATDPQTGQWVHTPEESAGLFDMPHALIHQVAGAAEDMQVVGQGSIGEAQVLQLRAERTGVAFGNGPEGLIIAEAWMGLSDLRPHRLRLQIPVELSELGSQFPAHIGNGPGMLVAVIGLSAPQQPVTIQVPDVGPTLVDGRLPGTKMNEQINLVIDFGESHPDYSSTPATSGWHYGPPDAPAAWGVHLEFIPDEVLLQNLAQGGVGLHYNCPDGCPDVVSAFSAIAARYPKIVVSPYEGMDHMIALTAWTFLDVMDQFDPERVDLFVRAHHGSERAPEHYKP